MFCSNPLAPQPLSSAYEVDRARIKYVKPLGKGNFGEVYLAEILPAEEGSARPLPKYAAVKALLHDDEQEDFRKEAEVMKRLHNRPHVVQLLAEVFTSAPELVLLEVMERGCLREYLLSARQGIRKFTPRDLLEMAWQVSDGMKDIADARLVHRDLAARNVLVSKTGVCKVADFGLTRAVSRKSLYVYAQMTSRPLPVRWMAPEAIEVRAYTEQSDVWSFGVLMWEIFALGDRPYQSMGLELASASELLSFLRAGRRLPLPDGCPAPLYAIMLACWSEEAAKRPSFRRLEEQLRNLLQQQQRALVHACEDPIYNVRKEEMCVCVMFSVLMCICS